MQHVILELPLVIRHGGGQVPLKNKKKSFHDREANCGIHSPKTKKHCQNCFEMSDILYGTLVRLGCDGSDDVAKWTEQVFSDNFLNTRGKSVLCTLASNMMCKYINNRVTNPHHGN